MKRITLCADDYGMTQDVSRAILSLADKGRIQATSAMVTTPLWPEQANNLKPYVKKTEIGLHLNLSEGKGLTPPFQQGLPSLYRLLICSHLHLLNHAHWVAEIHSQITRFIDTMGRLPDFIDGHQHVHHLPVIRQALLEVLNTFSFSSRLWIRSVFPLVSPVKKIKERIIENSGARALRQAITREGINTNTAFAGVYSLTPDESFRPLMQSWLADLPDGGLIMCHPGFASDQADHSPARQREYDYLHSEALSEDCHEANVTLQPLSRLA